MFWGITLEHGKVYSQIVEMSFHISMAALGFTDLTAEPTTVMVESEKANYAICTLQAGMIPQQPLDMNFTEGEEVKFFLEGNGGEVHLTGYLLETPREYEFDEEDELEGLMTSEDEASSSESEQGEETATKNMDSSDDSSKEMETVGAVEVVLEEKVCIDGEGNGVQDGDSDESNDSEDNSDGDIEIPWQAALTGDLDADSAESDDVDNDWRPGVKKGTKKTKESAKVKEKQRSKRKVDGISVKKPISQTLVDLMDMDDDNHDVDDDDDDDSSSDEDWAPESSKGLKEGLSGGEKDFTTEKLDS